MTRRLASGVLVALTLAAGGSAQSGDLSGKYVVSRSVSERQGWLELRTFPAESARPLTPRPVPGERRTDCCPLFSPDGSKLAFVRRTQVASKLLLLDLETRALRTVVQRPGYRDWRYVWALDSRSLLHSTYDPPLGRVHRALVDGPRATISQYRSETGSTWPEGTSPDGSVALVVESKGEALYLQYRGPDVLYAIGDDTRVKLATTLSIGGASWSVDGSRVAYTADCYSRCQLEVVRRDGGARRRLTRFGSRSSSLGGYDVLPFAWAGRPGEIVYARGRTLYGVDAGSGKQRRIAALPCPRLCVGASITIVSIAQERDVALVLLNDETELVDDDARKGLGRLYQVSLLNGSFVAADRLRDAGSIWFASSP